MRKNILIVSIVLGIGCSVLYGFKHYSKTVKEKDCLTTKISSRLFDLNTFNLNVSDKLNIQDFVIVNQNSGKVIFVNGKRRKGIKNDYGHCLFDLYYQGEKVYEFGHFKTNNWHTNDYLLSIDMEEGQLVPKLEIIGPDGPGSDLFFKTI